MKTRTDNLYCRSRHSVGVPGRVVASTILAQLAGLLCKLLADEYHGLFIGIPRPIAVPFKPSLGSTVCTTFTIDQLSQHKSTASVLVVLCQYVLKVADWIMQNFVLLSETLPDSVEACIDELAVPHTVVFVCDAGYVVDIGQMSQVIFRVIVVFTKRLAIEPLGKHRTCVVRGTRKFDGRLAVFSDAALVDQLGAQRALE